MSWPQTNYKQSTELGLIHGVHQSPTQTTFSHTQLSGHTPAYFYFFLVQFITKNFFPALMEEISFIPLNSRD